MESPPSYDLAIKHVNVLLDKHIAILAALADDLQRQGEPTETTLARWSQLRLFKEALKTDLPRVY